MDETLAFRLLFSLLLALGGALVRVLWVATRDNKAAHEANQSHLNQLELKVACEYVSTVNHTKSMDVLFSKLDRIEDKLDRKQDKD